MVREVVAVRPRSVMSGEIVSAPPRRARRWMMLATTLLIASTVVGIAPSAAVPGVPPSITAMNETELNIDPGTSRFVRVEIAGYDAGGTFEFGPTGPTAAVASVRVGQVRLLVTAEPSATAGWHDLTVVNPDGLSDTFSAALFVTGAGTPVGDVAGRVFEDLDGNGSEDGADSGLGGVAVDVTDVGTTSFTVITDANGDYVVTGAAVGIATVAVTAPAGYALSTANASQNVTVVEATTVTANPVGHTPSAPDPTLPPAPGLTPLIDMNAGQTYQGETGRLYDSGNGIPTAHLAAAPSISPIDGRIGVISLGMSNGSEEWRAFMTEAVRGNLVAPEIKLGNGAVPGHTASDWADRDNNAWDLAVQFIADDGLAPSDVQVVWMKMGSRLSAFQGLEFQAAIDLEAGWIRQAVANAETLFPNLKRVYVSSRIYTGYSDNLNHEEPTTGYNNAWSNRMVVADSLAGAVTTWVAWGPYLWADGTNPRSDGLTWEAADFERDGVHPSASGEAKVADMLLSFFRDDPSTCPWFPADPCS